MTAERTTGGVKTAAGNFKRIDLLSGGSREQELIFSFNEMAER